MQAFPLPLFPSSSPFPPAPQLFRFEQRAFAEGAPRKDPPELSNAMSALGACFSVPILATLAIFGGVGHPTIQAPEGSRGTVAEKDQGRPLWLPQSAPVCGLDDEPVHTPRPTTTKTSSSARVATESPPVMGHGKGRGTKSPSTARVATVAPPVSGHGKGRGTSRASPPSRSTFAPVPPFILTH